MVTLRDFFKEPADLLRLDPEELGSILVEAVHDPQIRGRFTWNELVQQLHRLDGAYWTGNQTPVIRAIFEALMWLVSQGLVMRDPEQSGEWYILTRRGSNLKSRADVEAYRKGGVLPIQLLQPELADKVHHLFVRGDHDTAVFQAFKTLEVTTRAVCGYGNDVHGVRVFTQAFHIENGPLTNQEATRDERGAEVNLFIGAFGHCRNPTGHRDIDLTREEAARLIVFASHLLAIVEERAEALGG